MKFIDEKNNSYAIGKCKNNMPPKHFLVTGESREVLVDDVKAKMFIARERSIYVVIKINNDYLYAASHEIFKAKKLKTFVKPIKIIEEVK
jgi:hypothetical protein